MGFAEVPLYSARGLQGRVLGVVGRRIVSGEIPEGASLAVDKLESEFGVSRTVVREAVRVLTAKGLVDARPRTGTYVLPQRSWKVLDADVMAWRATTGVTRELLRELDELRRMVEPSAAGFAAARRVERDLFTLRDALDRMSRAHGSRGQVSTSLAEHVEADKAFHAALLFATHNELIMQLEVMLQPLLQFRDSLIPEGEQSELFLTAHEAVFERIVAQDPSGAAEAMNDLLDAAAEDLERLLGIEASTSE